MFRRFLLAAAITASALAGAAWAEEDGRELAGLPLQATTSADGAQADGWAQRWGSGPDNAGLRLLSARAIAGSLARQGYRNVDIKRLRGSSYIAEAQSPHGNRVLLVVDGRTSEITGRQVIEWDKPKRDWDNGGWWKFSPWSGPRW